MRRLWVITECYPRPAAPTHCAFAHRQMVGLSETGWAVQVLVPNGWFPPLFWRAAPAWRRARRDHVPKGWHADGIRVRDLTYQNRVPSRLSRPREHDLRVRDALVRLLADNGVDSTRDVLLAQFALPYGGVVREAARMLGVAYAVQLRGDDVWVWPHESTRAARIFSDTVRDASLVLAVCRALIDEAARLCQAPLPSGVVVPNGIDLERFRPAESVEERAAARFDAGIRPGELAVLCVGDAIVRKGWRELLVALEQVARSADGRIALLAAIGSRASEMDLMREGELLAPSVRIVVRQDLPSISLARLYQAADVFCLPSHWEGVANALLEAMASGCAVVTTDVAGHPEAVTHGLDGMLVEPRNVQALESALREVLGNVVLRETLGGAARRRALRVGSSKKAGARLARALEGMSRGHIDEDLVKLNPYATSPGETSPVSVAAR